MRTFHAIHHAADVAFRCHRDGHMEKEFKVPSVS